SGNSRRFTTSVLHASRQYLHTGSPVPTTDPKQRWLTVVHNHPKTMVAGDFFVVITATFLTLCAFVVMEIGSRHMLHHNVTAHPTAERTLRQFREALRPISVPLRHARSWPRLFADVDKGLMNHRKAFLLI